MRVGTRLKPPVDSIFVASIEKLFYNPGSGGDRTLSLSYRYYQGGVSEVVEI
jgi:hypothetical protein